MPSWEQALEVAERFVLAVVLGGIIGYEREQVGKSAGLRTHMLVALGSTMFTLAPIVGGMTIESAGRVIQGITTGVGFIGAGTILKRPDSLEVQGLTTAATLWLTAALGVAVGVGQVWLPILGVIIALVVLQVVGAIWGKTHASSPSDSGRHVR